MCSLRPPTLDPPRTKSSRFERQQGSEQAPTQPFDEEDKQRDEWGVIKMTNGDFLFGSESPVLSSS